jgi:hypothetical protein
MIPVRVPPIRWPVKPGRAAAPSPAGVWRDYLTEQEREVLDQIVIVRKALQALNDRRPGIVNRAIQRARYALGRRGNGSAGDRGVQ